MKPIVFLHGWSMNSDVFRRQKPLAESRRIITPDLKGTGRGQITSLLSSSNEAKPVLAGWSMGVSLILSEIDEIQSLASGLIFISGTPCFISKNDFPCGMRPAIAEKLKKDLIKDFIPAWEGFAKLVTHVEKIDSDAKRELNMLFDELKYNIDRTQALSDLDWLYQSDFRENLKKINLPVLILSGSEDRICSPHASKYMNDNIQGSSLHLIEGAGHMPFFTRHDDVNRLIMDFTDGH